MAFCSSDDLLKQTLEIGVVGGGGRRRGYILGE